MTNCLTDLRGQVEHLAHEHHRTEGTRVFQAQCATWLSNWRGVQFKPEAARVDYCAGYFFQAVVEARAEGVRLDLSVDMESCRPTLTVLCDGWSVLGAEADNRPGRTAVGGLHRPSARLHPRPAHRRAPAARGAAGMSTPPVAETRPEAAVPNRGLAALDRVLTPFFQVALRLGLMRPDSSWVWRRVAVWLVVMVAIGAVIGFGLALVHIG
jgi:hypothetical protein